MQELVRQYDVFAWTQLFMDRLAYCRTRQQDLSTAPLDAEAQARLRPNYTVAAQRLLLLDYDGTLVPLQATPQRARPDAELLELLHDLTADARNQVVIISGRDRHTLTQWLGHLPLDFIAEHGVWLRRAGQDWTLFQEGLRADWKPELRLLLEQYVRRTPGSFIEEKDYSLAWHYRRADAGLAELRARELLGHLGFLTANTELQALEGHKVIEVKHAGLHKGTAAARWLSPHRPDFILALGDDRTDEDTFAALPPTAYTVKVGRAPRSRARFGLPGPTEVRALLRQLL